MKWRNVLAAALVVALLAASPAAAEEKEPDWAKLLEAKSASIVNVKFVLKVQITQMGRAMPEQEGNREVRGAVVNDKGLVLTALSHFDPSRAIRGIPPQFRSQISVKGSHSDLKVLFGNEEKEYEAQIVARDSNLGLAFLQILDLGEREVTPVDLSAGAEVRIGQTLFGVSRLARGFDCAPTLGRIFISARVEKPRPMWAFNGEFGAIGLPVFDVSGVAAGIVAMQEGSEGASDDGPGMRPFILPLSTIARSLKAAEERAAQALEKAEEAAEEEE